MAWRWRDFSVGLYVPLLEFNQDVAGGVAPHPPERALHLPRRRTAHRPGCDRGGAGVGVTEFSGVWAYNPISDPVKLYEDRFWVGGFLDSEGNKLWFCSYA